MRLRQKKWVSDLSRCDDIFQEIQTCPEASTGITAQELCSRTSLDRAGASRYLNQLCRTGKLEKMNGRPVRYRLRRKNGQRQEDREDLPRIVGMDGSLKMAVRQAKAAILYPPYGLHTLILGETGVGKSMFAEAMHDFACRSGVIREDAPFIRFNCADYADNPQLLVAQIFGVKKGAYSGAEKDRTGLLQEADGGMFFLDEVHRLPPQGQEMLFTFIDKGAYRPLGDTGAMRKASVRIVAATTEDPRSSLLGTFTRRIPMTITLPPLRERTIEERFALVKHFLCMEAGRLQHEIYAEYHAVLSFLLYDCPNNIGQLRSDVQLACAQAFLVHRPDPSSYVLIRQEDLQARVKRGILHFAERRGEIQEFLDQNEDIMVFRPDGNEHQPVASGASNSLDFYSVIACRADKLRAQGMTESEVRALVNVDIEQHFRRYLSDLPERFRRDELAKVVSGEVIDLAEELLLMAEKELEREFDEKVYYGLTLHLSKSLERIRYGSPIYHPQLNHVRKQYRQEFQTAMHLAHLIEDRFQIEVPLDEIGYIAMFLIPSGTRGEENPQAMVQILVLMHGPAVASGMAEVANTLAGIAVAKSLDMPLSMKVENIYEQVRLLLRQLPLERGLLLLVDMGSLSNFAGLLQEEFGVPIRCLDMVSTPIVIEACRKAAEGCSLEEIYRDCRETGRYRLQPVPDGTKKPWMIVTACFTGTGTARYLKEYLEKELDGQDVAIEALNILDRNDFCCRMQTLSKNWQIVAVVGTVNFPVDRIPFFPAADILAGSGLGALRRILKERRDDERIRQSLQAHLKGMDVGRDLDQAKRFLQVMKRRLNLNLTQDVCTGIAIHLLFMIDRILNQRVPCDFPNCAKYEEEHLQAFAAAREGVQALEKEHRMVIPDEEIAFLVRMCLENHQECRMDENSV